MTEGNSTSLNTIKPLETIEFMADFAEPYTDRILDRFIGIDDIDFFRYSRQWAKLIENPPLEPNHQYLDQLQDLNNKVSHDITCLVQSRRRQLKDDLISTVVLSEPEEKRCADKHASNIIELILLAGMQSTPHLLSRAMLYLAHDNKLHQLLMSEASLIPSFIDELLRFDPPVQLVARKTTAQINISNITIPENSNVILIIASANRDPDQFLQPDQFDIMRANKSHLAFSKGIHQCMGMTLAKVEVAVALEALLSRFSNFECLPRQQINWFYSYSLYGFNKLNLLLKK